MKIRTFSILFAVSLFGHCAAQTMTLLGGSAHVLEGTSVRLDGPLEWTIAPGATLVNDGIIDLGANATLLEQQGSPVTGTGVERTQTSSNGPFSGTQPGGLGLTITTADAVGPIEVVRGHSPFSFPEGDPSIARWYTISTAPAPGSAISLMFNYDPTELNGLDAGELSLFTAPVAEGPWSGLASMNDPSFFVLEATLQYPWGTISAFDENAPTTSPTLVAANGFQVWPTVVEDLINIVPSSEERINTLEVFDGLGRSTTIRTTLASTVHGQLHLGGLTPGAYFLRVNGTHTFKFRKV